MIDGTWEVETRCPGQTIRLGRVLGEMLPEGTLVALTGDLGAGKTVFTKGIARGLGVEDERDVTSPTFVLINEYKGRVPVFHVDLYRLRDCGELEDLGWEEITSGPAVVVVEWAEKAVQVLPEKRIEVRLEWIGAEARRIGFAGRDRDSKDAVNRLGREWMKEG